MHACHTDRVTVVIPTYNERATVRRTVNELMALPSVDLSVLIVDDASPDGTGAVADALTQTYGSRVGVLHRARKDGLGRAYIAGMSFALDKGADVIVQMDADGSHPISAVPALLTAVALSDDVAIGSRYVEGGSVDPGWPRRRRALSWSANQYIRQVLHLDVRDATAGFKAWREEALRAVDLRSVASSGYSFQIEMAFRAAHAGLRVSEVPIHFSDRQAGASKMTFAVQREGLAVPWRLRRSSWTPVDTQQLASA